MYDESPFFFGRALSFQSSFFMGLSGASYNSSLEHKLGDFVDAVKEYGESIQEAIKILALGIDYRKYSKFKAITPSVIRMARGDWFINRGLNNNTVPPVDDAQYCWDFVIESSLVLSEFDYSVTREK